MIPIYNDTVDDIEINLDRELNLNEEFNLEEQHIGAIQEYIFDLDNYKNFEWQSPLFIHINYIIVPVYLTDIWYGNEIEISIGYYDGTEFQYQVIEYREGFQPSMPEKLEGVYDGLSYKGEKRISAQNVINLSQRFAGFGIGLDKFKTLKGLVVRAEIVSDGGDIPEEIESTIYYINFNPSHSDLDEIPSEGEFNNNLSGRFDIKTYQEPTGAEDWVIDHSEAFV